MGSVYTRHALFLLQNFMPDPGMTNLVAVTHWVEP